MTTLTLKMKEIVEIHPALAALSKKPMPAKTAYRVGKLAGKVDKLMANERAFEAARFALFQKFGEETDPVKQTWMVKPANLAEFNQEMAPLLEERARDMEEEVALDGCAKIDFASLEKLEIEPQYIAALEPVLDGVSTD